MAYITIAKNIRLVSVEFVALEDDEEDLLLEPDSFDLTKAQAVRVLDRLYLAYITANSLEDTAPDFRTLIDENVRATHPPSAAKTGVSRGNRGKYGAIPHVKYGYGGNTRLFFRESDLIDWFNLRYVPVLIKAAA